MFGRGVVVIEKLKYFLCFRFLFCEIELRFVFWWRVKGEIVLVRGSGFGVC